MKKFKPKCIYDNKIFFYLNTTKSLKFSFKCHFRYDAIKNISLQGKEYKVCDIKLDCKRETPTDTQTSKRNFLAVYEIYNSY